MVQVNIPSLRCYESDGKRPQQKGQYLSQQEISLRVARGWARSGLFKDSAKEMSIDL